MLKAELKSKINQLWDRFWAGGLANPLTAIEQISYLIFIKRLEEMDEINKNRAEARNEKHVSIFKDNEKCKWTYIKHLNAEEMLVHVKDKVFPFIKNIQLGEDGEFAKLMHDAIFMIPKPSLLQEAVTIIDDMKISPQNYDSLGDMYEYLLSELSSAGKVGQFRTPRHIIRMMVNLVDPQLGQKICDPACGTAGFLVNSYQYILETNTSKDLIKYDEDGTIHNLIGDKITDKKLWEVLRKNMFFGFDFDQTMVRIAAMNMILHGIENPNIRRADTLSKNFVQKAEYDIILANPPFTGSIDKSDINDNIKVKTSKTELLFLELFYNLLQIGGKGAIIVPNGVLFGSSNAHKEIRKILLENCQLEAVISMPSGVFQPYSGVGTAVLVFTKGGKTENVWFYEMLKDGFSLDQKRDFIDGKGDIQDIIKKFKTKAESKQSFSVTFKDIKENEYNLSISRYKENEHEEIKYEEPKIMIDRVLKDEYEITKGLEDLKKDL